MIHTILLIDDNKADNLFHKIVMKKSSYTGTVRDFRYAQEALDYLKASTDPVDLILLDVNMPRMTGFEFLEKYKNDLYDPRQETKIIMLSTSTNDVEREQASLYQDIGVIGFLSKPLTQEQFSDIMEQHPHLENVSFLSF